MIWEVIYHHSPWLIGKKLPLPKFERDIVGWLRKNLPKGKVLIIYGPRQVGKTIALYQLAQTYDKTVIYILGDDVRIKENASFLPEVAEACKSEFENFVLIVDEAHKMKNWSEQVKTITDLGLADRVVVSGSSAYRLIVGTSESLVGRCLLKLMLPMSLREMMRASGFDVTELSSSLSEALVDSLRESSYEPLLAELKRAEREISKVYSLINGLLSFIEKYGGYPEIFFSRERIGDLEMQRILKTYVWLSIYKDAMVVAGTRTPEKLEELFFLISRYAGAEQSTYSLSKLLGVKVNTVENYLSALKQAFLIFEATRYEKSPTKTIKGKRKYYPMDPGLRNAFLGLSPEEVASQAGFIREMIVAQHMLRLKHNIDGEPLPSLHYWSDGVVEVDLIVRLAGKQLAIEVKSSELEKAKKAFARMEFHGIDADLKIIVWGGKSFKVIDDAIVIPLRYFLLIQPRISE